MSDVSGRFKTYWEDMRNGSTNLQGPARGRVNMPQDFAPLQIYPPQGNYYSGGESANRAMDHPGSNNPNWEGPLRSQSDQFIADRVKELSQADSPHLRELAFSLGNMVHVETPRSQPQRSFRPAHLEIYDIAHRWQVLQGCNDWRGKLDPIDHSLKAEIIRYGEFAQATYDAFDGNSNSLTFGDSLFDKESLLEGVGLANRGYEITSFIYATTTHHINTYLTSLKRSGSSSSESSVGDHATTKESNWIGFVAVCTSADEILRLGRRDIVIAWRGTMTVSEWIADLSDYMSPAGFGPDLDCSHLRVQAGFYKVYTSKNSGSQHNRVSSARDQVMDAVKALVEQYKGDGQAKLSITVTGHSLGSALATLCAYDIAASGYNLLSEYPRAPQRWSSEGSRTGAGSHEDGHDHVQRPHIESVKSLVRNSLYRHSKEGENSDEGSSVRHPHTEGIGSYVHSKLHHIKEGGHRQRIIQDVKNFYDNNDEAERNEFPPGKIPITVISFAGPRVGNVHFRDRIHELGVAVLRVSNVRDLVTALPGLKHIAWAAEKMHKIYPHLPSYKHVGVKLEVDNLKSSVLKTPSNSLEGCIQVHSLDTYLHLVDIYLSRHQYAGPTGKTFRDYALVNRSVDFLLPQYCIPPRWKGAHEVARDSNGNWLFPGRVDGTVPNAFNAGGDYPEFWNQVDAAGPPMFQHRF